MIKDSLKEQKYCHVEVIILSHKEVEEFHQPIQHYIFWQLGRLQDE